jgi:RNA 3'-terminal phosphate cyclase (ATP)
MTRGRPPAPRRWIMHAGHGLDGPHVVVVRGARAGEPWFGSGPLAAKLVTLDGSRGEGGGQILRTALTLSLLTGRPFRLTDIRANRTPPGLRPQHLAAVETAAALGGAQVEGARVGARGLTFRPAPYVPEDLDHDIGTAGATALVLQTLHLPIALRSERPIRVTLTGGTFNDKAPSFPFLEQTWRRHLRRLGLKVALAMPSAGFYPSGGGRLDAWIEPGRPRPIVLLERGPLVRIGGVAGTCRLQRNAVAERMRDRALAALAERGLDGVAAIELADWPGPAPGAAIALTAECAGPHGGDAVPATFVTHGRRGKPAEQVAVEAVAELLGYLDAPGAVDEHSADQLLLPLALADGASTYTVARATEHLRTNAATIAAFLDRTIRIEEPEDDGPARVVIL